MISTILHLTRPLIIFDTETTGVDPLKDRIVEIGYHFYHPNGLHKSRSVFVNPGCPIPPGATAIHGITDADVSRAYTFEQMAQNLANGFSNCDFGGQNIRFDLRIVDAEMQRAGVDWSYAGAAVLDAGRLEQIGEPRSLSHLYEKHLKQPLVGAHGTLADVGAAVAVIEKQLEVYQLPRDLAALHDLQWPGWIDVDGRFRFVEGVPVVCFGKHRGLPMPQVPRDYWIWIATKSDMPEETKQIAVRAARREFPGAHRG